VEDHHRPLVDRESTKLAPDPVALGDGQGEVGVGGRLLVGQHVQLDDVAASRRLRYAVTGTDSEPVEPGVPCLGIAQRADVAPRQHERFLDRVLGSVLVPKNEGGCAEQPGNRRSHQGGERVVVAGLCSFDELDLHVATVATRLTRPRSNNTRQRRREKVPSSPARDSEAAPARARRRLLSCEAR
jgi:hypothetical protein